jgi:DNA-binding MarR family transcriptional regulator
MYDEMTKVFDEAILMVHRSVVAVEQLHEGFGVSVPMRAVLQFLRARGDHTVSAIARSRSVTRQHIQVIVNELAAAGLVERVHNPQHRRAPLIRITDAGAQTIDAMHAREREAFEPLLTESHWLSDERLAIAGEVLRQLGSGIERRIERGAA